MAATSKSTDRPRRRLVLETLVTGRVRLPREPAHYVRDVLRLGVGATLGLADGHGRLATATVVAMQRSVVELEVGDVNEGSRLPLDLTVALAPPKGERADWVVEKLTEVGVSTIVWLETERTVRRPRPGAGRAPRWQRLAEAAAAQCGRATVPAFVGPVEFDVFLALHAVGRYIADGDAGTHLCAHRSLGASALLGVGPEGGFADAELAAAVTAGFARVRFGPLVMRVETAAVAGAALLMGLADAGMVGAP